MIKKPINLLECIPCIEYIYIVFLTACHQWDSLVVKEKKYIYIYTQYRVYFFPNLQECDKIKLFAFGMVIGEIFDCKSVEIRNAMATTYLQQNLSDSFVTGCYCWGKKVISVLSLNLNQ